MSNDSAVCGFMVASVVMFCLFSNERPLLWNLPEVIHVKSYDNDIMLMANAINTHVLKFFNEIKMRIFRE